MIKFTIMLVFLTSIYVILATTTTKKYFLKHTLCLTTQNLKDLSRKRKSKPCLANVTLEMKFQLQHDKPHYCKVVSTNTSQLEVFILSLSWPIQSDLLIADWMITPLGQKHSNGKTQYIAGKQVLVRS
jgi:hypothetical protein